MRILLLSDTHYSDGAELADLAASMRAHDSDLIVIAGDMLDSFHEQRLQEYVEVLAAYSQPKLCVIGNHDLWHERDSTSTLYKTLERFEWHKFGVDLLNVKSSVHGGVAFVGTTGWYDYAFLGGPCDVPSVWIYSCDEFRNWENLTTDDFRRLLVPENRKPWIDLSLEDLERKVIATESDGEW